MQVVNSIDAESIELITWEKKAPVMCGECWLNDRGVECVCGDKPLNDFEIDLNLNN